MDKAIKQFDKILYYWTKSPYYWTRNRQTSSGCFQVMPPLFQDVANLLPCYCQIISKLLSSYLPSYCQVIAKLLPCYCHVIANLLLIYCREIAMLLLGLPQVSWLEKSYPPGVGSGGGGVGWVVFVKDKDGSEPINFGLPICINNA